MSDNRTGSQKRNTKLQPAGICLLINLEPVGHNKTGASKAVSPEVIGHAITPSMASAIPIPPIVFFAHIINGSGLTVGKSLLKSCVKAACNGIQGASGSRPNKGQSRLHTPWLRKIRNALLL